MKSSPAAVALLLLCATAAGCDVDQPGSDAHGLEATDRGPLGKADLAGTCQDTQDDFCGGQSAGACWCDASCVEYGDCCPDRAAVCEAPPVVAGPQQHPLLGVRIVDSKALGERPVFTIAYEFGDDGLGHVEVSCNDETATTTLTADSIADGQPLRLQGNDFYCFRLESLVSDLADVTDGHTLPSFAGVGEPDVFFDLSTAPVAITIDSSSEDSVVVHARSSDVVYEFAG